MGLLVKEGEGKDFEICPEGTFIGRLFQIIDLGTIKKAYKNDPPKNVHEIRLGFEILDESAVQTDGTPFRVGNTYTASLDKKANLRKALEAIRGPKFTDGELKGFLVSKAIGVYCQITIVHAESNGKTYANISAFSPLHKSMAKPSPVNANVIFDLDSNDYMDVYANLPKYYQDRISESFEWQDNSNGKKAPEPAKEEKFEDDPFPF